MQLLIPCLISLERKRSALARMAKGLRMDARRAKTRRSRGVVHDSRTPTGGKPKAGMPWIGVKL